MPPGLMDPDPPQKPLLGYAVCAEDPHHFAEGFADIRDAPRACPVCGNPLHTTCPNCGMLYRTGTGICTNCGERLVPAPRPAHPTSRIE